ncbi:DUF7660 family protein [Bacillus ndiopicus]|uniref:DUF7660 family protein n=1 Tax=Bacillus ndiopicus TaxID=1347368 RepID=UPI0005AB130E|nr:hypothetical protein [Bacillus ndiopicus]
MDWYDKIENVTNKEQFLEFVNLLSDDYKKNRDEWENKSIDLYLQAIESWMEDMEEFYGHSDAPISINWNFLSKMLYVGKIYE